ncbi:hypothetical protein HMPREF1544_08529 [Mucor circinelloides 1006PhL]|uniref:Pentacotripeptide-repeat region of PRORP domain-containing protein n=1 Tax=Mucor circinelloides f. circinelloides (strain 1006PhL) TaxID=1220926 RepID=S2JY04_MUCC1|nr:hypothetical protein HMPREF1544_08529 [Mucor circinelloides 1006PhL]
MVFRSCLCSRKYQPLFTLYKLKPFYGPPKYPGILLSNPRPAPSTRHFTTTTHQLEKQKDTSFSETHPELFSVLTKKYTTKQAKSYYRRLSKQSPEQLADLLGSIAEARGYDRDLLRVTVDAAAYWPLPTIQRVLEIWNDQYLYLQLDILKSILLKKYVINRDIVPIINALPEKGALTNVMPFYNAALSKCRDLKEYQHLRLISTIMKERNMTPDTASYNILLRMRLDKEGADVPGLQMYDELVDEGAQPNHATFNTFIKHAIQRKEWDTLEQWLDLMKKQKIKPTPVTLRILFRALCVNPNQPDLSRAFDRVSAIVPLTKQEVFLNTGTSALLDQRKTSAATDLLKTTLGLKTKLSTYAYNLLLRALCQQGQIESAQHVLTSMITTDSIPEPDIVSFTTVIHGLIRHSDKIDLNQINALYDKLEQQDLRSNNVLQSVILYALVKSKDNNNLQKTRSLFDSIISNKNRAQLPVQHGDSPLSEINTYNMMMDFYFLHYHKSKTYKNQIPKQVFQLLNEAVEIKKLTPTLATMNIMVRGLAVLNKDLVAAEKVVELLKNKGVAMDEKTVWYLAKSAYRQGQISKARQFIDDFKLPITQSGLKELNRTLNKWDQQQQEPSPQ